MITGKRLSSRATWLLAFGAVLLASFAGPKPAHGALWQEGVPGRPFSLAPGDRGVVRSGQDEHLDLGQTIYWSYTGSSPEYAGREFDPHSAQRLANGDTLVADADNVMVVQVSRAGRIVWSYTAQDDPAMLRPFSAYRTSAGTTLIADRNRFEVIEVDAAKRIVWKYGSGASGRGPNQLADPFSAVRLENGDTLITDNQNGWRVLQVRTSDYRPGAPHDGFSSSSIVWQYGESGVAGSGAGHLYSPRQAERLANGDTLIADAWNQRVLEVAPDGRTVWQYGVPGVHGHTDGLLFEPSYVTRLANGNTLITDKNGSWVLEATPQKKVVWSFGLDPSGSPDGSLDEPRSATRLPDGTTLIADEVHHRLIEVGHVDQATASSAPLDFGAPGVAKRFDGLAWTRELPPGASVEMRYSIDGKPWASAGRSGTFAFPAKTKGETLAYRLILRTSDRSRTPVVGDVSVSYALWTPADDARTTTGRGRTAGAGDRSAAGGGTGGGDGGIVVPSAGQGSTQMLVNEPGSGPGAGASGRGSGGGGAPPNTGSAGRGGETARLITGMVLSSSVSFEAGSGSSQADPAAARPQRAGSGQGGDGPGAATVGLLLLVSAYAAGLASSGGGWLVDGLIKVIAHA
jgi:hypothetical protein